MEVSLLLAEVEKKYASLKSYEDQLKIVTDKVGTKFELSFRTRYLAPDKLIIESIDTGGMTSLYPPMESVFDGSKGKVVFDKSFIERMPQTPFNLKIGDENMDSTKFVSYFWALTSGASNYTLPLLLKGTKIAAWTKEKDFRSMGKKKLGGVSCHVIRRVSHPVLIWIGAKDYSIRRVELGTEIVDKIAYGITSIFSKVTETFWKSKAEIFKGLEDANLETVCTFENIKFNSLTEDDMNFV